MEKKRRSKKRIPYHDFENVATARSNDDQGIRLPPSSELSTNSNAVSNIVPDEIFNSTSHAENALKVMQSYFRSQQLTDVTLVAGNKRIAAHRLVLSASSDYFAAMFTNSLKEPVENEIDLMDIDGDALLALVQYFYTVFYVMSSIVWICGNTTILHINPHTRLAVELENRRIKLRENNVETLLVTASRLQVNPVITACAQFLIKQLNSTNCLGIKKFTKIQGCDNLSSMATAYALENFVEVVNNREFLSLSAHEVAEFLQSEDVIIPSEETIFNALVTWLEHDVENRNTHASELLKYVKLPLLTPRFITDHIQNNELFRDQNVVRDLILEAFTYNLLHECTESLLKSGRTKPRKSTVDVLLAVGRLYSQSYPSHVEAFYLEANTWENVKSITISMDTASVVFFENELFLVGGSADYGSINTVKSFNFSSGLWKVRPQMNTCRNGAGVAVLEGLLYAIGGFDGDSDINTVERWDPVSKKWNYVSPLLTKRCKAGVAVVNNKLYVVGGWDGKCTLNTVECYDPNRNQWSYRSPMLEARDAVELGVLNGYIYVTGGNRGTKPLSNSVERYDPRTDTWATIIPMSVARRHAGVGVLGDRLIVVGGFGANGCLTSVESYDPALDEWKELAPLKYGRAGPCVVVNNSICKL